MSSKNFMLIFFACIVAIVLFIMRGCRVIKHQPSSHNEIIHVQASGSMITSVMRLTPIKKINLQVSGELYIDHGQEESLKFIADENIIPYITTKIVDEELIIGIKPRVTFNLDTSIKFYLTIQNLDMISASGSSKIITDHIQTDDLALRLNGTSVLHAQITVDNLSVTASGMSSINLSGKATHQNLELAGNNKYFAQKLTSSDAIIRATGSLEAKLHVNKEVSGSAMGSSFIEIWGNPEIKLTTTGATEIIKK